MKHMMKLAEVSLIVLLYARFSPLPAETGMILVTAGTSSADLGIGNVVRIDIDNDVVKAPVTIPQCYGLSPRFSPDGQKFCYLKNGNNTVAIVGVNGGEIKSFSCDPIPGFGATLSWTDYGIWVGLDGKIVKYDTNGTKLTTYITGPNQRTGYVSKNEITGGGVWTAGAWKPWVYQMRTHTNKEASLNTDGCSVCPSPNGLLLTNNILAGPDGDHRSMRLIDTNGIQVGNRLLLKDICNLPIASNPAYYADMQCWSSNSNDWILIPVGQNPPNNRSPCIYNITTHQKFTGKDNSGTTQHWQPFDYYSGWIPNTTNPSLQLAPSSLSFAADSGAGNPPTQTVAAATAIGSLQGLSIAGAKSWLNASPAGTSGASINITNRVTVGQLAPGTYVDTLTVSTSNAGSKQYVVTLTIRRPAVTEVLSSMNVMPKRYTVGAGASINFLATCKNQAGKPFMGATMSWTASGGGTIDQTGKYTAAATPSNGHHLIIAAATAAGITLRDTAQVMVSRAAKASIHKSIDCGTDSYLPTGWTSDNASVNGGSDWNNSTTVTTAGIPAAAPANVYLSTRRGNPHSYRITGVPQGNYTVRMHFVDPKDTARSMIYSILGTEVLRDFSISTLAGGANRALVLDFMGVVQDTNGIPISCSATSGDVFEAGIEVIQNQLSIVTLLSPLGGQTFSVGQAMQIRFCTDTFSVQQLLIDLSVNNGRTWNVTTSGYGITMKDFGASWGTYTWTIPDSIDLSGGRLSTISDQCRLRIRPYETAIGGFDASDSAFSIKPRSATISLGRSANAVENFRYSVSSDGLIINAAAGSACQLNLFALSGKRIQSMYVTGASGFFVPFSRNNVSIIRMKTDKGLIVKKKAIIGMQ